VEFTCRQKSLKIPKG